MPEDRDREALIALLKADRLPVLIQLDEAESEEDEPAAEGSSEVDPGPFKWKSKHRQAALGILWRNLLYRLTSTSIGVDSLFAGTAMSDDAGGTATSTTGRRQRNRRAQADVSNLVGTDVLIICPLVIELNSALFAFGIDPGMPEDANVGGHKLYLRQLQRQRGRNVQVAISVITKERNALAAMTTQKLIRAIRPAPQLVLMSGIGGGVKSKVNLGDVVLARSVIDVAGGRAEPDRLRRRDNPYTVVPSLARQMSYLPAAVKLRGGWADQIRQGYYKHLQSLGDPGLPAERLADAAFKIHEGTVVAGEQLVADGSLEKYLELDDRIRSCDMEGSGFAQAADECGVPWALFRSISDFGDIEKTKEWQPVAAYAAALVARRFLEWEFRTGEEMRETDF